MSEKSVIISVPGHGEVEFPAGMTDEEMASAIRKNFMLPAVQPERVEMKPRDRRDDANAMQRRMGIGGPNSSGDPVGDFLAFPYELGGRTTDVATSMGASPEVAASLGVLANMGGQAIPVGGMNAPIKAAQPLLQSGARKLMQSAVKPAQSDLLSGDAARAIETMLQKGYNPTEGGVMAMEKEIAKLGSEVDNLIAGSTSTVNKGEVGLALKDTFERFRNQVNPNADMQAVREAWMEFRNHPALIGKTEIPVQLAQKLKQGTYSSLGNKAYGEVKGASIEAQKGLARGLKEGINKAHPEVAGLNAAEGELINAATIAQRRALMSGNRNPASLALLAPTDLRAVGFLADKSDLVKALLARGMYSGALPASRIGAASVMGGLYDNEPTGGLYFAP
jgi:hypothetical protein